VLRTRRTKPLGQGAGENAKGETARPLSCGAPCRRTTLASVCSLRSMPHSEGVVISVNVLSGRRRAGQWQLFAVLLKSDSRSAKHRVPVLHQRSRRPRRAHVPIPSRRLNVTSGVHHMHCRHLQAQRQEVSHRTQDIREVPVDRSIPSGPFGAEPFFSFRQEQGRRPWAFSIPCASTSARALWLPVRRVLTAEITRYSKKTARIGSAWRMAERNASFSKGAESCRRRTCEDVNSTRAERLTGLRFGRSGPSAASRG
jgi:hypothetical protein